MKRTLPKPKPPYAELDEAAKDSLTYMGGAGLMLNVADRIERAAQPLGQHHVKVHVRDFHALLNSFRLAARLIDRLCYVIQKTQETLNGWWD